MDEKEYKFWKEWITQKENVRARLKLLMNNKEGNKISISLIAYLIFSIGGAILIIGQLFVGVILEVIAFIIFVLLSLIHI